MSESDRKKRSIPSWRRPPGPINVWRIIDGFERLPGGGTKPCRFSIQDVPEDRFQEAIEHMCEYFTAEEATCKSLKIKEDKDAIEDFQSLWDYLLKIGLSVGAFKIDSNEKLLELVAINIIFVSSDEIEKALENFTLTFKSPNSRKIFKFMHSASENIDVREIYSVDSSIEALGLSVKPPFRGQQLGVRLLEARTDIGRKYNIPVSSTIFTATASQIQATRAGFEVVSEQYYANFLDENGKPLFPNIESPSLKIMIKKLQ